MKSSEYCHLKAPRVQNKSQKGITYQIKITCQIEIRKLHQFVPTKTLWKEKDQIWERTKDSVTMISQ